jgi:methylated-DNA-[protein]-cysteine S-methyltransferase
METTADSSKKIELSTPFGGVQILLRQDQVVAIHLSAQRPTSNLILDASIEPIVEDIKAYFDGHLQAWRFSFELNGTPFQKKVWQAIASVPFGQTISYQNLANLVGSGPRAVANACGANPLPLVIPCHRIVASRGLGGFMKGAEGGLLIKQWLLEHERK